MNACRLLLLGLWLLPVLAAAERAREVGWAPMRSWTEVDHGGAIQVWRVKPLPDGRVAFANNLGVLLYDGAGFVLLPVPGGTVYDVTPVGDRLAVATGQALGFLIADARGEWQFEEIARPPEMPPLGDIGRIVAAHGRVFFLSRTHLAHHHPELGWQWRAALQAHAAMQWRDGALWVYGQGEGWLRFDPDSLAFDPLPMPGLPETGLAMASEDPGLAWLASDRQRVLRFDGQSWQPLELRDAPSLFEERIEALAALPDGQIAVGTRFGGLYQFDGQGQLLRHLPVERLPGERITDLALDPLGVLWLALDGGIVRIEADDRVTRFDRADGAMSIERIRRIDGRLLIATRSGLKVLQPDPRPGRPAQLVDERIRRSSVWDLLRIDSGTLVALGNGLALLPPDPAAEPREIWRGARVSSLLAAPDGWIYAVASSELRRLRERDGRIEMDPEPLRLLPMFDIAWEDGALWISIDGGDVFRLSELESWPSPRVERLGAEHGLGPGRTTFTHDRHGLLLFHRGRALRHAGAVLVHAPEYALDAPIDRLIDRGDGPLWASADGAGLLRLEAAGDASGWAIGARPLARFQHPSRHLHLDDDGVLWLGGDRGLLRMAAEPNFPSPRNPPQLASLATAAGERLYAGGGFGGPPPSLEIGPNQRDLRIRLSSPGQQQEAPPAFQWRIDGGDWRPLAQAQLDWQGDRAGSRQLAFRAIDSLGRASPELGLELKLAPWWHETLLARSVLVLLALVLMVLAALGWARWRTRRLEQDRRRLEALVAARTADIEAQAAEILALSEARTRFFANVSHELRTPLTLILGPLGDALQARYGELAAALRETLEGVRNNARRLLALVGELLDLSRLAAGHFALRVAEHDLAAQARSELAAFTGQARSRGIELLGEGLEGELRLHYDAEQIARVLANLLSNALKFTPGGGHARLRLQAGEREVCIEVEDDGPGIAAVEQGRVFERFYQGSADAPVDVPGTGIGLALVRELVELHGGRVELDSAPGRGSRFRVHLLRGSQHFRAADLAAASDRALDVAPEPAPTDAAASWNVQPVNASGAAEPPRHRPSLLLVDDHAELRRYLADRLGDAYAVIAVADGAAALRRIAEELPDAVVSDVMMPGVDGLALARQLRSNPETAGVPLLLLSARSHKRDIVEGLAAGADDYLVKPFDTSELIARIEAQLDLRRRLRAQLQAELSLVRPGQADPSPAVEPGDDQARAVADGSREPPAAPEDPAERRFRERLEQALAALLPDPRSGVAELASALHMDRATLFRRVRQGFQTTPSDLLRERRLARARQLLSERRGNVSEIAYAVGFDNLSHFSQAFRKRYGQAPSALVGRA